ncbi:uncharacterized protein EAF01_003597 [Botrytis porri]|uniref:uncharacterized protein n=1 Tax=Botrytis porri TaxID=87229 RepID=UPI0018FF84D1|nr:uncharacterized protein EAF01_003597 [Botrytis porri]KAF7909879.1 hypothetical protein EAF01_003597 [Botrytis porri]
MNSITPHTTYRRIATPSLPYRTPNLAASKPKRMTPRAVPLLRMRYFALLFLSSGGPRTLGLATG